MEQTFHLLLYRAFHAQRNHLRQNLAPLGLGAGQPKLLSYLADNGPCPQRELADYYEVDPAAVSRMLDARERGGVVVRRPAADGTRWRSPTRAVRPMSCGSSTARSWRK